MVCSDQTAASNFRYVCGADGDSLDVLRSMFPDALITYTEACGTFSRCGPPEMVVCGSSHPKIWIRACEGSWLLTFIVAVMVLGLLWGAKKVMLHVRRRDGDE